MPDFVRIQELSPFLPVVFWVHEGMSQLQTSSGMAHWRPAFEACSRIVFQTEWQSQTVYKSFLSQVEPHRICHVPSGVHWPDHPAPRTNNGSTRIVFVGGVYPNKRPADLVQAVLRLPDLPMHCTLIGNVEHLALNGQAMQDALANNPHRYTMTGQIAQADLVQQHYQQSHIFCLPSGDECSPRSVFEAAANGLPLALSDLPCHQGIWRHGENALLSPVGAVDCLSWNLRALSQDQPLADRLSRAARATARRFGMEQFLQSMTHTIVQAAQDRVHLLSN
jgi:glycosyltransferase involved in cell wall biosynthesis